MRQWFILVAVLLSGCITVPQVQEIVAVVRPEPVPTVVMVADEPAPILPEPVPASRPVYDHGRHLTWYTAGGKLVHQWEDGFLPIFEANSALCVAGASRYWMDKTGIEIPTPTLLGTRVKVLSYYSIGGTYDDGSPARVPDQCDYTVEFTEGFYFNFSYAHGRDAIAGGSHSGNGIYWAGRPGNMVYLTANHKQSYKGLRTGIRANE
ncbi:MAG: hypothetical protein D4S01_04530 [Dehalococcoidia bacterium]|nr:MAG: hypothetical protein D4S01_04530 [Dehalococcoidia bacterium]